MAFARGIDHLDGDELSIEDFVLPHPDMSFLFRVKDDRMAEHAILRGDVAIIERGRRLGAGHIALVAVDGETRLIPVAGDRSGYTFDDRPSDDSSVVLLGVASRIIRPLLP